MLLKGQQTGNDVYHQHKQAAGIKSYFSCTPISSKSRKKDEKEKQVFFSRVKAKQLHTNLQHCSWGHLGHNLFLDKGELKNSPADCLLNCTGI